MPAYNGLAMEADLNSKMIWLDFRDWFSGFCSFFWFLVYGFIRTWDIVWGIGY